MSNYAKTTIIGNLGRKPQLFNNDATKAPMCVGSVAVGDRYPQRDANGNHIVVNGQKQYNEITTWYNFQIFGARATAFYNNHEKGDRVLLEGEMRSKKYLSNLKAYPCYNADGTPVLDQNNAHFHAYVQVEREDMTLRVADWKFMKNKPADNTAYAGNAGVAAQPQTVAAAPQPQPQPQPQPVNTGVSANAGVPVNQPQTVAPNPQTVATAFTGNAEAGAAVPPQFSVDESSQLPAGV